MLTLLPMESSPALKFVPNSESVNEALRFLIRITQQNKSPLLSSTDVPNNSI